MKTFRIIIAAPFILIGALFYKIGELISGELYTRNETTVRENVIFEHNMYQAKNYGRKKGSNRTPAKKKRK